MWVEWQPRNEPGVGPEGGLALPACSLSLIRQKVFKTSVNKQCRQGKGRVISLCTTLQENCAVFYYELFNSYTINRLLDILNPLALSSYIFNLSYILSFVFFSEYLPHFCAVYLAEMMSPKGVIEQFILVHSPKQIPLKDGDVIGNLFGA